jgi:hypothetical protein
MKSKTALFRELDLYFYTNKYSQLKANNISHENYDRTSCIYICCDSQRQRMDLERKLYIEGFKVNFGYAVTQTRIEVQVSYFKGFR